MVSSFLHRLNLDVLEHRLLNKCSLIPHNSLTLFSWAIANSIWTVKICSKNVLSEKKRMRTGEKADQLSSSFQMHNIINYTAIKVWAIFHVSSIARYCRSSN